MPLQFIKVGDMSLLFVYLEICHYNFITISEYTDSCHYIRLQRWLVHLQVLYTYKTFRMTHFAIRHISSRLHVEPTRHLLPLSLSPSSPMRPHPGSASAASQTVASRSASRSSAKEASTGRRRSGPCTPAIGAGSSRYPKPASSEARRHCGVHVPAGPSPPPLADLTSPRRTASASSQRPSRAPGRHHRELLQPCLLLPDAVQGSKVAFYGLASLAVLLNALESLGICWRWQHVSPFLF